MVIITFNRAGMLEDVLLSLVRQKRLPDEVVVVDNNSTDSTKEVAEGFKKRLNIRYVFEEGKSIPVARNTGIKNSSGDIIAFTDDDCLTDKEWLYYVELNFIRDPSIGMVGGEILHYKTKGTIIEEFCIEDAMMRVYNQDTEKRHHDYKCIIDKRAAGYTVD